MVLYNFSIIIIKHKAQKINKQTKNPVKTEHKIFCIKWELTWKCYSTSVLQ